METGNALGILLVLLVMPLGWTSAQYVRFDYLVVKNDNQEYLHSSDQTVLTGITFQYSIPVKCYICDGPAEKSECADPMDVMRRNISYKVCSNGVCLKYTVYRGETLYMVRGCSSDINFHLTLIDGVCRSEKNGNGYLCMCGKHMCNASQPGPTHIRHWATPMLTAWVAVAMIKGWWLADIT